VGEVLTCAGAPLLTGLAGGLAAAGTTTPAHGHTRRVLHDGVTAPAFRPTSATTAYGARQADGSLPATTFLTTGSTAVGATMR
jgi:hypothetical protein